jgi:Coenzyme PQQ synthesis protein D (PqqD)
MTLRLRPDVSAADTEYGTVLLDESSGVYWHLNVTGAAILAILCSGGTRHDAVRKLVAEFDVDLDQARRDVDAMIAALSHEGLTSS